MYRLRGWCRPDSSSPTWSPTRAQSSSNAPLVTMAPCCLLPGRGVTVRFGILTTAVDSRNVLQLLCHFSISIFSFSFAFSLTLPISLSLCLQVAKWTSAIPLTSQQLADCGRSVSAEDLYQVVISEWSSRCSILPAVKKPMDAPQWIYPQYVQKKFCHNTTYSTHIKGPMTCHQVWCD